MKKYKITALIGVFIMGIGSVMSCLGETLLISNIGSTLLLLSIGILSYAFYHWRP